MSRETQYIGLTRAAQDFVAQCESVPSDTSTTGMFDEKVPLGKWKMHPVLDNIEDRDMCIREVVQEVPWSSGPMIFTCIELDWGNGGNALAFEWTHDPTLGRAFCQHEEDQRWQRIADLELADGGQPTTIIGGREYDREKGTTWV